MNRFILFFFGLCILQTISGQPFLGKMPLRIPLKYYKPTLSTLQNTSLTEQRGNANWNIWIDRDGITTSSGYNTKFLDRFLVVEESEDKIHLVKYEDGLVDLGTNRFSKEPVDCGWVDKKFAILWHSALFDDKTKFRLKILTITDPSVMSKRLDEIRNGAKMMAFYNNPSTQVNNKNETSLFQVFYIYKKDGSRVLLGKSIDLANTEASYVILGWVDQSIIQAWGSRQTLEPNYSSHAASERKSANMRAAVFANRNDASTFSEIGSYNNGFWYDDKYERRMDPYWKRLPILGKQGNVIETAVVSDLIQEDGTKIDVDIFNSINKRYNEQRERSRKINLIFVVDGSHSMAPYINSVRQAVLNAVQKLGNTENDFKFGAVIYRDYKSRDDDACYEIEPLTNYKEFYTFMAGVETDNSACFDNTDSEGLYKGLIKTKAILRGKEKETNIIILVGDAGDRAEGDRYTEADVIPVLSDYGISLLTIQVHRIAKQAYEDFIYQTRDLSLKSATKIVDHQKEVYGGLNLSSLSTRPRWQQDTKNNRTMFTLQFGPVSGGLQYANPGQNISPAVVESEIERILKDISDKNDKLLNELSKLMEGMISPDAGKISSFSAEAVELLMKAGFRPEDIKVLMQRNYQFLLRGYTSVETKRVTSPVFSYSIFMDEVELGELKTALDKLYIPGQTSTARRERFRDSWLQILKANYGAKTEDIENRSLAELAELITGLPSPNPILTKYTLNDITDITKLPNNALEQICNLIKEKRDRITRDAGNKSMYFLSNDYPYYWIPQEDLP